MIYHSLASILDRTRPTWIGNRYLRYGVCICLDSALRTVQFFSSAVQSDPIPSNPIQSNPIRPFWAPVQSKSCSRIELDSIELAGLGFLTNPHTQLPTPQGLLGAWAERINRFQGYGLADWTKPSSSIQGTVQFNFTSKPSIQSNRGPRIGLIELFGVLYVIA